jgi:pyruvate/2-oxoglutarate dehydrogenase complex dihydrolipoamide dehydrogenase (E3) component
MSHDVIVIGGGPVGETLAERVVLGGLSCAIVESSLVGGDCAYYACMPSKGLLRSGSLLQTTQRMPGTAQAVTPSKFGVKEVLERRNEITHHWNDASQVKWVKGAGIELIRGRGEISGVKKVKVTTKEGKSTEYEVKHAVVVAAGSDPMIPDVEGLKSVNPWTSREATSSQTVPPSLLVIGGGVVAVEMATAWNSLGSKVTIASRRNLLEHKEPFAGELLGKALKSSGVALKLGVTPVRVVRQGDNITVHFNDGSTVTASQILVATGRVPRTYNIGLNTVGVPEGWLPTDDTLLVKHATNQDVAWLYATGDVNRRAVLTHQGEYQARAAGDVIAARAKNPSLSTRPWGKYVATADHQSVPQVIFTSPEVGSIGLTEAEARGKGYKVRAVEYDIGNVAGAFLHEEGYTGKAKMVVDEERQVLLGVTFVGPDVAELVHAATIAVVGEVSIERLWHAVPSFPTISEIWLRLLEAYGR